LNLTKNQTNLSSFNFFYFDTLLLLILKHIMKRSSEANQSNSEAVSIIVQYLKAQGIFDQFRRECLEDVDTKVNCFNLIFLQLLTLFGFNLAFIFKS